MLPWFSKEGKSPINKNKCLNTVCKMLQSPVGKVTMILGLGGKIFIVSFFYTIYTYFLLK